MASAPLAPYVPVEEYLHTAYRPDVDYVDGYLKGRNLGEFDHGTLIMALAEYFRAHRKEWNIRVALDCRLQITGTRFRVPDLSITSNGHAKEQILRTPPILCIEILSPEDTFRKMRKRVEDYFALGVGWVWIFDYSKRTATVCCADSEDLTFAEGALRVPGTPIAVPLQTVFAVLDEE